MTYYWYRDGDDTNTFGGSILECIKNVGILEREGLDGIIQISNPAFDFSIYSSQKPITCYFVDKGTSRTSKVVYHSALDFITNCPENVYFKHSVASLAQLTLTFTLVLSKIDWAKEGF